MRTIDYFLLFQQGVYDIDVKKVILGWSLHVPPSTLNATRLFHFSSRLFSTVCAGDFYRNCLLQANHLFLFFIELFFATHASIYRPFFSTFHISLVPAFFYPVLCYLCPRLLLILLPVLLSSLSHLPRCVITSGLFLVSQFYSVQSSALQFIVVVNVAPSGLLFFLDARPYRTLHRYGGFFNTASYAESSTLAS